MQNYVQKVLGNLATRHYARVMAFAVFGVLIGGLIIYAFIGREVVAPMVNDDEQVVERATSTFARSAPVHLTIPKINLDTTFVEPLGLNSDKTVSVPNSFEQVGWYKGGASPGEIGPAIFYSLGRLEKGDEVEVTREDGSIAVFVVTDKERVSQDNFPTEKVYGAMNYAGLRLVTCTGIYNRGTLKYSHNLIVYAELKK